MNAVVEEKQEIFLLVSQDFIILSPFVLFLPLFIILYTLNCMHFCTNKVVF